MDLISRTLAWFLRFTKCISILGVVNSFKLMAYGRLLRKDVKIYLEGAVPFTSNAALDLVTSHFYGLGYYIQDVPGKGIQNIVDAGANIGVETMRFYMHHANARIVAVEASQRNFQYLKTNFERIKNVNPIFAGLWPTKTKLSIESTGECPQEFKVSSQSDGTLDSITIPEILQRFNFQKIDILKLDIEGAELALFTKGDLSWIDKINVFIIEIGDQDAEGMTQAIFNAISHISLSSYMCGENLVLIRSDLDWTLERVMGFKKPIPKAV